MGTVRYLDKAVFLLCPADHLCLSPTGAASTLSNRITVLSSSTPFRGLDPQAQNPGRVSINPLFNVPLTSVVVVTFWFVATMIISPALNCGQLEKRRPALFLNGRTPSNCCSQDIDPGTARQGLTVCWDSGRRLNLYPTIPPPSMPCRACLQYCTTGLPVK